MTSAQAHPAFQDAGASPLENFALIEVSGIDAATFLQRQLTVEVLEISPKCSRLGAYLNPKGRVICNFILVMRKDSYCLVVDRSLAEVLLKRLKMYIFREKINIDIRPDLVFAGSRQPKNDIQHRLPQKSFETLEIEDQITICMPGSGNRFGIIAEKDKLQRSANWMNTMDSETWLCKDVEAGIPWITHQTSELFVAQAINLDLIDSISWTKGCYPGQEIVARLHYRGGINRRMVIATSEDVFQPKPGDSISCPDLAGNQTGTVVNAIYTDGTVRMLVSVPLRFLDQENIFVGDIHPVSLRTNQLPYVIPQLEKNQA